MTPANLPPTNWFRITYAEAAAIAGEDGILTPAMLAAHYRTDMVQLFAWAATPPPVLAVSCPPVMEGSAYGWYVLSRDFMRGLKEYTGHDVPLLPYPQAAATIAFYKAETEMVSNAFSELREDLRGKNERMAQPPGYWDRVADELEFTDLGIPPDADPFEYMKKVPLWRYFSIKLMKHRVAKAQRRAMEMQG